MDYYVKSVVPMIESNYDNFTIVEKTIADFFIRNRERIDLSAKSVSEMLYVSEASLSRFAKKCGYRGYREFVYQYEETFVEKQESITGNTRIVLNAYQELLNKTYNLVDETQIARIGRYLNQSERVFVYGIGGFGFTAEEMELRFMRIGVDIDSVKDADLMGMKTETGQLFETLYTNALKGDPDCGGLLSYGYYSGENITMLNEGRLAFLRTPESHFNLANFMKVHLYTSLGAVKLGMDILMEEEKVKVDRIMGHGGFFKTKGVGQRYLAAAVKAPVTVMDTASEGGAWGIALLAAYRMDRKAGESLEDYLENRIFCQMSGETIEPCEEDVEGFGVFMDRYKAGLEIEKTAIDVMDW